MKNLFRYVFLLLCVNSIAPITSQASALSASEPAVVRSQLHGFSMYPTIKSGDYVVYRKTQFSNLKPGDIVVFVDTSTGERVCHRIVEIEDGRAKSKGDNNRFRDRGFISDQNLLGKVTHIGGRSLS